MAGAKVAVALEKDRRLAAKKVARVIGMPYFAEKEVLIKPNLITSDPSPGSTHIDTLSSVLGLIKPDGPRSITVADRSGPMNTRQVFEAKGLFELGKEDGFDCLVLDEMSKDMYKKIQPPRSHWKDGFLFAPPVVQADRVVCLCCLKTPYSGRRPLGHSV